MKPSYDFFRDSPETRMSRSRAFGVRDSHHRRASRAVVALCASAAFAFAAPAQARIIDRIAAIVNSDVITLSEVDILIAKRPDASEELKDPDNREAVLSRYRGESLETLIAERLLEAEIRKRDLRASELQTERAFELQLQSNRMTRERFVEELGKAGLTLSAYKEELGKRLQRQMLLERLFMPKIKVTDEDVQTYYNQNLNALKGDTVEYCVTHVLRHTPPGMSATDIDAQRVLAEQLQKRALAGEDFGALAKLNSQDPSASRAGDIGCFKRGQMVKAFEEPVFKMKKGEISGVIKTQFGFHVAKVTDIKGAAVRPFKEVAEMIRMKLTQDQMERQVTRWVEDEKKKAFIDRKIQVAAPKPALAP